MTCTRVIPCAIPSPKEPCPIDLIRSPEEPIDVLTWEDSYAIARALRRAHPQAVLAELSLGDIYHWTIRLPGFQDDRELANESILSAIVQEWFEEENPL